jgi:hypothetical protein
MIERNFLAILQAMKGAEVEFLIVGGLAAALNGVPIHTLDVDLVHSREAGNVGRLLPVLMTLDAIFRLQPERLLDLETVIMLKEELAGEKDRAMLPILRRTLAELRRTKE